MKELGIDIETFSSVDLARSGVYKYASSGDFEILLFGYSVDGGPVEVIDLTDGSEIPEEIIKALTDDNVIKTAFNASFERVCLSAYLGYPVGTYLSPMSWHCTMIAAAYLGLPLSLKGVGEVLKLEEQKMDEGKDLIKYFCVPCEPTKKNGGRVRNTAKDDPESWETFKKYNKRDVEVEKNIKEAIKKFPVPESVWAEYVIDQKINDVGVYTDRELAREAIRLNDIVSEKLLSEVRELTEIENPNSVAQLKSYLKKNGLEVDSLGKKDVAKLMETAAPKFQQVLSLRMQLAKSSIKKYEAIENAALSDDRVRGMFQFYGANRTGRWAGRLVQMQNLPQNHLPDLSSARELVKSGNLKALEILYEDVPDTLSQLIRTAFIPEEGRKFIVADYSAVEARVLAWYAGETWRMKAFSDGADIYCASASKMFGVPVEKHGVNAHLRQKGKIAELALGYGGSVGALKAMGALDMGLSEEELQPLVSAWRASNSNITNFWWTIDRAVKKAVKEKTAVKVGLLNIAYKSGFLFITLPSGRTLSYVKPRIGINKFGTECVTYEGVGATKKWERIESYGPKFVENIIQATSRDLLSFAMKNLQGKGDIVMHVHDEIVTEVGPNEKVETICEIMGRTPPWAEGLVLRADGYECEFYQKD